MEKKKNNIFLIIIILLIVLIGILTIYKMNKKHEEKLYNVLYSEIKYKAKKCYLDGICNENISLSTLYDNKYLDIMYDPISKEALDENIKIKIENGKVNIDKT